MMVQLDQKIIDAVRSVADWVKRATGVGRLRQARAVFLACILVAPVIVLATTLDTAGAVAVCVLPVLCLLQIRFCNKRIALGNDDSEHDDSESDAEVESDGAVDPIRFFEAFCRLATIANPTLSAMVWIAGGYNAAEAPWRAALDIQMWLFALGNYLLARDWPGARRRREQRKAERSAPAVAVEPN